MIQFDPITYVLREAMSKSKQNCDDCVNCEMPCRDGRIFLGKQDDRCEGFKRK